jgi:hypothetical protein
MEAGVLIFTPLLDKKNQYLFVGKGPKRLGQHIDPNRNTRYNLGYYEKKLFCWKHMTALAN